MLYDDIQWLIEPVGGKIVLLVMDGLGGLPDQATRLTELETAKTPNFDSLVRDSACGLHDPVATGITPGSGPSHLGLFGYDPIRNLIGRGALSAAGVGFPLEPGDVAARANFCTLDSQGKVTDRRAGRISTGACASLCERLEREIRLTGAKVFVKPERDHRAAVIFRAPGLSDRLTDHDPLKEGLEPKRVGATEDRPEAHRAAGIVNDFLARARQLLRGEPLANGLLLRGFTHPPRIEPFQKRYRLNAACVAVYPMYKGLASLVGMKVIAGATDLAAQLRLLKEHWDAYDFFFVHVKGTDSAGEDGDFARKVQAVEEVDAALPGFLALAPGAFAVTGDHSTPSVMRGHSWHPVPVLIHAKHAFFGGAERFTERECARGTLGRIHSTELMPLLLAHAGRLSKYGA